MNNKLQLNISRLGFMLKHDIGKYWKRVLIIIGGAFVFITLFAALFYNTGDEHFIAHEGHATFFPMILFGVGFLLVSFSFKDLYEDSERSSYLGLPASHLEKYLSRFILTFFILPIFISMIYCIYAFLYDSVLTLLKANDIMYFSFFSNEFIGRVPTSFDFLKIFFPIHSIFFLGAITFRKLAIIKTFLNGFILFITIISALYFCAKLILPELFTGWVLLGDPKVIPNEWFQGIVSEYGKDVLYGFLCLVVPVFLWTASYFKLTEKEA